MNGDFLVVRRCDVTQLLIQIDRLLERSLQNNIFFGFELHAGKVCFLLGDVHVDHVVRLLG